MYGSCSNTQHQTPASSYLKRLFCCIVTSKMSSDEKYSQLPHENVLICSDFRKIGSETVWGNIPLFYGIAIVTYMPSIILALSTRKTIFFKVRCSNHAVLLLKCADISIFILFPFFPHTHITCKKHSLSIITPKALLSPLLGC